MTTEPDKDVELLALFVKGAMALHPNLDPDGDALEALASLESQNQALQGALERMTHRYCGTNRVTQDVRWARQVLGWDYEKGCARSVEAVRKSHAALSPTQETDPEQEDREDLKALMKARSSDDGTRVSLDELSTQETDTE